MIGRCVRITGLWVCITLFATQALAQTAVQQSGAITNNSAVMWARDHVLRQAAGSSGDVAGKMITGGFSAVGNICSYTNTTDQSGIGLCLDPTNGQLVYNGVGYPVSGGGGNVVGPGSSVSGELTSFNNTTGTLLKQGAATLTDNKSAAISADGASITISTQDSADADAQYIWACALQPGCNTSTAKNYDAVRSVAILPSGSALPLLQMNGVGSYLINSAIRAGPPYLFTNAVNFFSIGIADADGAGMWGLNPVLTDNRGNEASVHGPRFLQNEFDFNVTSANTGVSALNLTGASLAQPTYAYGPACLSLDSNDGNTAKWTACLISSNGATLSFASIGTQQFSGNNISSQNLDFNFTNGAGAYKLTSLAATSTGLILVSNEAGASNISTEDGFYAADTSGFFVNNRAVALGNAGLVSIAGDAAWTTVNVGSTNATLSLATTDSVSIANGKPLNLVPAVAPASPAAGWHLYVDSGDANKLKAKASNGTVVTLGTP